MDVVMGGVLAACSAGIALGLTRGVRGVARRRRLLDHPSERSSHTVPIPRLGGIGIMLPFLACSWVLLLREGGEAMRSAGPALAGTATIAVLGAIDDLLSLSARWRFVLQILAGSAVVLARGPGIATALAPLDSFLPYPALAAGSVLWIAWATNLYNFMDGIDGLAGGQAIWASLGLAAAAWGVGDETLAWMLIFLGASAAGFLPYNLPRASIFMGDVGSTAIGFFLASVPFAATARPVPVLAVLLALSLFFLDSTLTLLKRLLQGHKWFLAHRAHLYQRPVARGFPHSCVTYPAYGGMVLLAGMSAAYPRAGPGGRALMLGGALVLFFGFWLAVRRLERRASGASDAGR